MRRAASRRISAITFLLLSLLAAQAAAALSPSQHLEKRKALEAAVAGGDHQRVVAVATELSRELPGDPGLWYELGRSAFAMERYELAIEASRRAWEIGYRHMPWLALRIARSAAALGREEEAMEWIERALERGFEDRRRLGEYEELAEYLDDPVFRELIGVAAPEDRVAGLRADLDFLTGEASRLHPGYPDVAAEFEAAVGALKRRLSSLSDVELLYRLMQVVARLEDGHSVVYGPMDDSPLDVPSGTLPLLFYLFDEGLYVVDARDEAADLIGRRVLRVGRRSPEELLAHARTLHGADNPMTMRWLGPHFYFPRVAFLLDADAIDDPRDVTLEVAVEEGVSASVTLGVGDHEFPRKLRPPRLDGVQPPRYLQRVDTAYWFEPLEDHRVIYFQFNQVRDSGEESIAEFAGRLGAELARAQTADLIVDLRHNNGGNNGLLRPLLRRLIAFDTRAGTRIFVITGRNTFSAAQNFVNRLARWTDAIFIGEPSSSSPNFIGEETRVVLPWSKILVSISSRYWQDSDPGDHRPWISPEIPIPPTASDYFAGRDAALEAVLSLIREGKRSAPR